MSQPIAQTEMIETRPACNPMAALIDVRERDNLAYQQHRAFFDNPEHQKRVAQVQQLVDGWFTVRKAVYVNRRFGHKRPFTVVKVDDPQWPRRSHTEVENNWRKPLDKLGVERRYSKTSNSWLLRIY
jgi:hypothetical protein